MRTDYTIPTQVCNLLEAVGYQIDRMDHAKKDESYYNFYSGCISTWNDTRPSIYPALIVKKKPTYHTPTVEEFMRRGRIRAEFSTDSSFTNPREGTLASIHVQSDAKGTISNYYYDHGGSYYLYCRIPDES